MYVLLILMYIIYGGLILFNFKPNLYYKIIAVTIPIPIIFFDPIETYLIRGFYVDTVRIFSEINTFRDYGWNGTDIYDHFILSKIYIFLFSFFEQDFNFMLPVINTFFVYFLALFIINKTANCFSLKKKTINFVIFYTTLMISFFNVTTNIRYPLAVVIIFLLLIYDLIKKRHRILCFLGYAILLLLHPGIIFIIIIRMLVYLPNIITLFVILLLVFLGENTILSLISILPLDVILGLIDKIDTYSNNATIQNVPIYFSVTMISYNISIILSSILLYKFLKLDALNKYKDLIKVVIILGIMGIVATLMGNSGFLGRAEELSRYLIVIYYLLFLKKENFVLDSKKYNNLKIGVNVIYVYMLIYFIYNILTYTRWLA